jgi:8-amino-7-oxononanoate synthase
VLSLFDQHLQSRLIQHEQAGLRRIRNIKTNLKSFSSNDYLGLSTHPEIIKAFQEETTRSGFGTGGSQLVSGHRLAHAECEAAFAKYLKRDKALLFANGYLANIGVLQAIANSKTDLYFDKYNHASLYDGAVLSGANLHRYLHGDLKDLEKMLQKNLQKNMGTHTQKTQNIILSEHIFSTDGSRADIPGLIQLSATYETPLIIDDAHGFGVFDFDYSQEEVPVLICPLGKALGGFGAIVAGSEILIETLIQFSRTYMFSTAPPPGIAKGLTAGLKILQEEPWRRENLFKNIQFFKETAQALGLYFSPSDHPIQSLILGDPELAISLKSTLLSAGFDVAIMRPPTVPYAKTLLRVSLMATHQYSEISDFLTALKKAISTSR